MSSTTAPIRSFAILTDVTKCIGCEDCVADCLEHNCPTEAEPLCNGLRPECEARAVVVVRDGWTDDYPGFAGLGDAAARRLVDDLALPLGSLRIRIGQRHVESTDLPLMVGVLRVVFKDLQVQLLALGAFFLRVIYVGQRKLHTLSVFAGRQFQGCLQPGHGNARTPGQGPGQPHLSESIGRPHVPVVARQRPERPQP